MTTLQVDHSQLSDLGVVDCLFGELLLKSVPKLTRMTFEGWISFHYPLSVGDAPLLEAVNLTNAGLSWHKMVELSKFLSGTSVHDLKLGFKCEKIWFQPECLTKSLASVFRQVRFVNLDEIPEGYDLTWTLFILKAAPLLKELYMTVYSHLKLALFFQRHATYQCFVFMRRHISKMMMWHYNYDERCDSSIIAHKATKFNAK